MITVGLTGPIGHGKSTFAKALIELVPNSLHLESSMIVAEIANGLHASTAELPKRDDLAGINNWLKPLPSVLLSAVHAKSTIGELQLALDDVNQHPVEYEKLLLHIENLSRNPDLLKHEITRENKESYRPILQWLGGYLVKNVDKGIWYKEIVRRVYQAQSSGYKLCVIGGLRYPADAQYVHSVGGKIIKVYRPGHLQYDMLDPTERERDNITPDSTVISNGTLSDVKAAAKRVLDDIAAGNLQKSYYAKSQALK